MPDAAETVIFCRIQGMKATVLLPGTSQHINLGPDNLLYNISQM
jgi:hypothetical protein